MGGRSSEFCAERSGALQYISIERADGVTIVQYITWTAGAVILDPDVQAYFPDPESVNTALRTLIRLIPAKKSKRVARRRVLGFEGRGSMSDLFKKLNLKDQ